jgi:hypothetical protein
MRRGPPQKGPPSKHRSRSPDSSGLRSRREQGEEEVWLPTASRNSVALFQCQPFVTCPDSLERPVCGMKSARRNLSTVRWQDGSTDGTSSLWFSARQMARCLSRCLSFQSIFVAAKGTVV